MIAFFAWQYRDTLIANLPYGVHKVVELGPRCACDRSCCCSMNHHAGLNIKKTEGIGLSIKDIKKDLGITVIMVRTNINLVHGVRTA